MESVLCWPTAPEHWICPGVCVVKILHWENTDLPFPSRSIANRFLVWGGVFIPLPLLRGGIMSGVNVYRHCACYHSLSNFIYISPSVSNKIVIDFIVCLHFCSTIL